MEHRQDHECQGIPVAQHRQRRCAMAEENRRGGRTGGKASGGNEDNDRAGPRFGGRQDGRQARHLIIGLMIRLHGRRHIWRLTGNGNWSYVGGAWIVNR